MSRKTLVRHWFLFALVAVLAGGFGGWTWLQGVAAQRWLQHCVVFATMFALTWPLPLGKLARSFRQPGPALLAFAVNLGAIPLMAWPLSKLLGPELGPGMIVLAATPSTLASAAVWTRRAGGNDVVAIINTLLTNGLCFLILPAWVWLMHGVTAGQTDFWGTAQLLFLLIVLPMLLSQLARLHHPSAAWATRQKSMLGIVAQSGILVMVLFGSVQAGERMASGSPPPLPLIGLMVLLAGGLHLAAWWLGYGFGGWLGMDRADRLAVGFSGSQKTLMIGLTTAIQLQLSILPMVAYHLLQLIIDTLIADRMRKDFDATAPVASALEEAAESG
jgi:solute carrier family 10 (sodium/bile acid cotransporter), member 7